MNQAALHPICQRCGHRSDGSLHRDPRGGTSLRCAICKTLYREDDSPPTLELAAVTVGPDQPGACQVLRPQTREEQELAIHSLMGELAHLLPRGEYKFRVV